MRLLITAYTAVLFCCLPLGFNGLLSFGQDADAKQDEAAPAETTETAAQQDETKQAEEKSSSAFDDFYKQWQEKDAKLKELADKFQAEEDQEARAKLKLEYADLVGEAKVLAFELRKVGLETYISAPNENEQVTRFLVGAIVNDIRFARYDDAMEIADALTKGGADTKHFYALRDANRLSLLDLKIVDEIIRRHEEAIADDLPRVRLETSQGNIELELFENEAPGTVGNFVSLVGNGYYNGLKFHRVIDGFVAQGGDPKGDGSGGPGYKIKDETDAPNARQHFRGYLSMANSGPDTGGSQFFIVYSTQRTQQLNGKHTVFGRVISGLDVADKLTRVNAADPETKGNKPDVIIKAEMVRKRDHEYLPNKVEGSESEE